MKGLSVIMWSAGFREKFHTPKYLVDQTLDKKLYELVWIEYFDHMPKPVKELVPQGVRIENMHAEAPWHVGKLVNEAVRRTDRDIIVVIDADVVVQPTFLESIYTIYQEHPHDRLFMHMQRWDELEPVTGGSTDWDELRKVCEYHNPRNYGGCLTVPRKWFYAVNGYEEGEDFQRASAVGMDMFTRLSNLGLEHMWHPTEFMMHPWHDGTGSGSAQEKERLRRQMATINHRRENKVYLSNDGIDMFPDMEKASPPGGRSEA